MKIGIVCYPTYGGSGVVATELGKALADHGHDIHFITYRQPIRLDTFHERLTYHEVLLTNYPLFEYPPYESALASKLVDVVSHHELDLLHVHYAIPHAAAAFLAKEILKEKGKYIPVVTTLHGTDITLVGKNKAYHPVVAHSINVSDGVTTVSESLKQETIDTFNIKRPIEVIPNFVDFNRFKRSNKEHFRKAIAGDNEKIIVHTSNFRKVKRVPDVIAIFKKVLEEVPSKLILVGDGPERNHVEELSRSYGVYDQIRFLGKQEAIEEILAVADLFLLPSEFESFGLAALEAMACEVPVISTNKGGLTEINEHGVTGFACDVGDIQSMANHAIDILSDESLLTQMRAGALEKAKQFDLVKIMPQYEAYYQSVVEGCKIH